MANFFRNILLLLALWVILIQCSFLVKDNPYWGNEIYEDKFQYLEAHKTEFNTAFIGSSKTLSQVNPVQLDALMESSGVKSINLGAPYVNTPEVYYLYEHLLQRDDIQLDYVFIELNSLLSIEWSKIRTKRNYYWCNFSNVKFAFNYLKDSHYSIQKKAGLLFFYIMNYCNKNLTLAHLNPQKELPTIDMVAQKGFGPMNANFDNYAGLAMQRGLSEHYFSEPNLKQYLNNFHLQRIKELIDASEQKGIHLIFLIPPRIAFQYGEALAITAELPTKNVIELGDSKKYPAFYQAELSSDDVHLNEAGARIFTKYLAEQFEKIISQ